MEEEDPVTEGSVPTSPEGDEPKSVWETSHSPWGSKDAAPEKEDANEPSVEETEEPEEIEEPEETPVLIDRGPNDVTADWSPRRRNRSVALQFLYGWELNRPDDLCDALDGFFAERELNRDDFTYAEELIHGATEKMEKIDDLVREKAENWDFDRIAKIDLTLLRLGIHELLHRPDVPPVVVINEIIDLGKAFSEEKSKRFLNGILDRVLASLDRPARESSL